MVMTRTKVDGTYVATTAISMGRLHNLTYLTPCRGRPLSLTRQNRTCPPRLTNSHGCAGCDSRSRNLPFGVHMHSRLFHYPTRNVFEPTCSHLIVSLPKRVFTDPDNRGVKPPSHSTPSSVHTYVAIQRLHHVLSRGVGGVGGGHDLQEPSLLRGGSRPERSPRLGQNPCPDD